MLKDMDFGIYGKGIDGYVHYSLAMDNIREEEEQRQALMDEFDSGTDAYDISDSDAVISVVTIFEKSNPKEHSL